MKRKLSEVTAEETQSAQVVADPAEGGDEVEADVYEEEVLQGRRRCPYLDTVNRQALDFDSEKLCSVTLTKMNVYVCLVCGKYFQGRGKSTPAYTHSVQAGHFVFMNLSSGRTFCLPDGYEVFDSSLQDAQRCLSPAFTLRDIASLNANTSLARDVHGVSYLPGFVGLNNLNCTDYVNALLHALAHVTPLRDYWLQGEHSAMCQSSLVQHFGLTLRKMWSSSNFKSTVSPQELMQELSVESRRRFGLGQRAECLDLLVWLLGTLHRGLGSAAAAAAPSSSLSAKTRPVEQGSSVIYEPFQGVIEITSLTKRLVSSANEMHGESIPAGESEWVRAVTQVPFTYLSVEIPPCPLFRDQEGGLVIPQVPLAQLLQKFDGATWTDSMTSEAHVRRQYRILRLPRYLILHLVRFTRNNFYLEKNPTIVTFPVRNLEMRDVLQAPEDAEGESMGAQGSSGKSKPSLGAKKAAEEARLLDSCPTLEQLESMSAAQLRQTIQRIGSELHKLQLQALFAADAAQGGAIELTAQQRADLLAIGRAAVERVQLFPATKYDLLANICHSTGASSSSTKGGVTVGDLNMLMGQTSAHKAKGKAAAAAAVAGSGSAGAVNAGAAAAVEPVGGNAAYTAASTTAANNKVLNEGEYKVHLQHKATGQWFELQDLHVNEISPQQIGVSESNILIYEKKSTKH